MKFLPTDSEEGLKVDAFKVCFRSMTPTRIPQSLLDRHICHLVDNSGPMLTLLSVFPAFGIFCGSGPCAFVPNTPAHQLYEPRIPG